MLFIVSQVALDTAARGVSVSVLARRRAEVRALLARRAASLDAPAPRALRAAASTRCRGTLDGSGRADGRSRDPEAAPAREPSSGRRATPPHAEPIAGAGR
jgi:hypothetical protein